MNNFISKFQKIQLLFSKNEVFFKKYENLEKLQSSTNYFSLKFAPELFFSCGNNCTDFFSFSEYW